VTNYVESLPLRGSRLKTMDVNGAGFAEMRHVLRRAVDDGLAAVTIILHSFSFIEAADPQYRRCRVRHYVVRRFGQLCRLLADMAPRVEVRPMCAPWPRPRGAARPMATAPLAAAAGRLAEHAFHEACLPRSNGV